MASLRHRRQLRGWFEEAEPVDLDFVERLLERLSQQPGRAAAVGKVSSSRVNAGGYVGPPVKSEFVVNFLIALAVFPGTALQMMLALVDAKTAHKDALAWARAEDELIKEHPRLRRGKVRKELRTWRDPDTDRSLAYVDVVLLSWTLLVVAAAVAAFAALEEAL